MTSSELSDYINNVINIVRYESLESKQDLIDDELANTAESRQESKNKITNIYSLRKLPASTLFNMLTIIPLLSLIIILFLFNENYGLIDNPYFGIIVSLLILFMVFILHTRTHYVRKVVNRLLQR